MQRVVLLVTIIILAVSSYAQRKIVVVDLETHIPVEGVTVKVDTFPSVTTNSYGVAYVEQHFDSISFRHMKYLSDKITIDEMKDTMYIVPKNLLLPDVVITGINPELKNAMKRNHERILSQPTFKWMTFNFANLIDRRARRDRKHYKKAKKILEEWDLK